MPFLRAIRAWSPAARVVVLAVYLATVAGVQIHIAQYLVQRDPVWAWRTELAMQLVLLGVLVVASGAWGVAFARRRVRFGTSAGLWVAGLALVARARTEFFVYAWWSTPTAIYDFEPRAAGMVWFHRNVALAAFAFGLAFVALACWSEARIRRRAPEWLRRSV